MKTITLKTINNHTTRIDAEWDIRLSGFSLIGLDKEGARDWDNEQ
jgi:hypothetical protein